MNTSGDRLLRLVASYKLLKAFALIAAGVGLLKLARPDLDDLLEQWALRAGLDPDGQYVGRVIDMAASVSPLRIRQAGVLICAYSSLYVAQGVGLWMLKPWAEWLTVVATSVMLPLEIYELLRQPTVWKLALLGVNVAIVAYLAWRIGREKRIKNLESKARSLPPVAR